MNQYRDNSNPKFISPIVDTIKFSFLIWFPARIFSALMVYLIEKEFSPAMPWNGTLALRVFDSAFTTQGALRQWLASWYRWDTGWYILIGHDGYETVSSSIIFPPLYPLLIRFFSLFTGGDLLIAAILISSLACFIMLVFFQLIIYEEKGAETARLATIGLMSFPAAFFFHAGYTESVYLVFALGAWFAVRKERFLLGGLFGMLAALTRSQGWVLGLAFLIMLIQQLPKFSKLKDKLLLILKGMPAAAGPVVGTVLYLFGISILGYGNVSEAFSADPWYVSVQGPWITLSDAVSKFITRGYSLNDWINLASLCFIVVLAWVVQKRLKPEFAVYTWVSLLFILMRGTENYIFNSVFRYVLDVFPVFIGLALLFSPLNRFRKFIFGLYVAFGIVLQVGFLAMFAFWAWVG